MSKKSRFECVCIVVLSDSQMFNPLGATPTHRVALHTEEDRKKMDEYLLSKNARGYDENAYGHYFWSQRNCKKPREISLDSFLRKGIA
jgi:hypothetical protein